MADLEAIFERHRLINQVRYMAVRMAFDSRRARLRGFWHAIVRRHEYEICSGCGRPVGPHTGSWWSADDALWCEVIDSAFGVRCPPCFTQAARERGIWIAWRAVEDGRAAALR